MNAPFPSDKLQRFGRHYQEYLRRVAKDTQSRRGWYDENGVRQGGLIAFVRYFWHLLEPENELVEGWPLYAVIEHLEAVTFGEIKRLLITVPPGFMKSMLTDVFWPAWEWGPMGLAHKRYIAFSYSASLTERDNERFRAIVASDVYQKLYGPVRTKIETGERANEVGVLNKTIIKVMNSKRGWKLASSIGGVGTGERGDVLILDDAHNIKEAESEVVRKETVRWFREAMSDRLNNLVNGVIVVIMQRSHAEDVAGEILTLQLPYCHLMIPMEFDSKRQVNPPDGSYRTPTVIGWIDPRYDEDRPFEHDGELAWEHRFPAQEVADLKVVKGPYAYAGQYQQSPQPREGGIFKTEWWQLWESEDGKFPVFDYLIASLDGAFTEDEENDPSALTVWGVWSKPAYSEIESTGHAWQNAHATQARIMLVHAWRKHLQFSAPRAELKPNESRAAYRQRTMKDWGLIEWVEDTCLRFKVDKLLIEAKASGISAAQEIQNRYGTQDFAIQLCPVKGDKVARALAVQPTFSQGLVYAPDRDWAEMVIEEMEVFPKGKYDDLTDSTTQALKYLREVGLAMTDAETQFADRARAMHRPRPRALYPV